MTASIEIPSLFELHYPGGLELVPVVRRFLFDLCNKAIPKAPELASEVALATHELLDNAARHGARKEAILRFEIVAVEPAPLVRLSVSNLVTLAELQVLAAEIERVRMAADPGAYLRDLRRTPTAGRSGFGLARLRADTRLSLRLEVGGNRATVVAQSQELANVVSTLQIPTASISRPISHVVLDPVRPSTYGGLSPARPPSQTNPSVTPASLPATPAGIAPVKK